MKRSRSREEVESVLVSLLGSGGYNTAFLGKNGHVYRIAAVKRESDKETTKLMARSSAIMKLIQQYQAILGPSTLREIQPGHWTGLFEYLDEQLVLKHVLSSFPSAQGYEYYLSQLEYLEGGLISANSDSPTQGGTFSLIYWLWVAQAHIGLRHRDISSQNILMRKYPEPKRFTFSIGQEQMNAAPRVFTFELSEVPVVIDFDFGSTPVTRTTARDRTHPKLFYAPPEVIMAYVRDPEKTSHPRVAGDVYDWWSLGLVIFDWWTGYVVSFSHLKNHLSKYARKSDAMVLLLLALVRITIVHLVIHGKLPDTGFDVSVNLLNLEAIVAYANRVRANSWEYVPKNIKFLIRRLLSWSNANERCFDGQAAKLLTTYFLPSGVSGGGVETGYNESRRTFDFCSEGEKQVIRKRSFMYQDDLETKL